VRERERERERERDLFYEWGGPLKKKENKSVEKKLQYKKEYSVARYPGQ